MPGLVVAYWKIRGLGAPLRMMCEYAGAEYDSKIHECVGTDKSTWFNIEKPPLQERNALMNLPYIIDGDLVITQSLACMTHLARKFQLYGSTAADAAKIDQILNETHDLRNQAVMLFYSPSPVYFFAKSYHYNSVKKTYGKFEHWLEQQGTLYTAGPTPTAGDFHLWEMLDHHEAFAQRLQKPSLLADFPKVTALYKAFRAEPKLQKYFEGELYKLNINQTFASFY